MIQKAREDILKANGGKPPKVLDPFGGGGAIPLEALRLGCEVYSNDYNPVAVLIQKCTLEYPQKYGQMTGKGSTSPSKNPKQMTMLMDEQMESGRKCNLLDDVKKWGTWVLEETRKEIGKYYPPDPDGSIPVGYIWAKTIPCQNPACRAEIPLLRHLWLAKKANNKVALYPYPDGKEVKLKIVGSGYEKMPQGFNPDDGTTAKAIVTCPVCGSSVEANNTRRLFQEGKAGQRLVAVVLHKSGVSGKRYRLATGKDQEIFNQSAVNLEEKRQTLMKEWGLDPVPDEEIPTTPSNTMGGTNRVLNYKIKTWGDLFNSRQKLALITFVDQVRQSWEKIKEETKDEDYAKAVVSYLSLSVNKIVDSCSSLCRWKPDTVQVIPGLSGRQAISMIWDYFELNPISGISRSWDKTLDELMTSFKILNGLEKFAIVSQSSATNLLHTDNFFDAVFTDPPYYDNVPYSYLSDFFYVWLKRSLGSVYPELFSTPLVPKKQEIVAYSNGPGGREDGKAFFEEMLKKSFQEIHRTLKPKGIAVIVYAHKSTKGWESLINSLLDSGLVITGAWPIRTEMQARMNAQETASLASSIYIIARKMKREATGFYNKVKEDLQVHLKTKLDRLWQEGIGGADFFISAIGSAIEIFGKYEKIMDYEGNLIRADRLLEDIRGITTDYAVRQILHNGFAEEITDLTRFYVLYRWNYGKAKILFDEAQKLAKGCSMDLSKEWGRHGFIKKEKEFIHILGPEERKLEDFKNSRELIDVLHHVLLLWENSKRDNLITVLKETGFGNREAFYRVAQAVSETLPLESKEKKLLDGFLAGREKVQEAVRDISIIREEQKGFKFE